MPRYTNDQLVVGLRDSRGMVYVAARRIGCRPDTIKARLARSPSLRAVLEAERGLLVDLAEGKLLEAIEQGDPWAIQFCLRTQGRDRGYALGPAVSPTGPSGLPAIDARLQVLSVGPRLPTAEDLAALAQLQQRLLMSVAESVGVATPTDSAS